MRDCEISKVMSFLYFWLYVFCQFEVRIRESDPLFIVLCTLYSMYRGGEGLCVKFWDSSLKSTEYCLRRIQENVMNTSRSFYSMVRLIKLIINTAQINHLSGVPRDSITGWEKNNNMNIYYPVAADPRWGCLGSPWMCTIHVHPSWRLQIDWVYSGLTGGGWVPWVEGGQVSASHDSTGARLGRDPQYTSFFCMAHWAQLHTWRISHNAVHPTSHLSDTNTASQKYNDDISLLISQYLIPGLN